MKKPRLSITATTIPLGQIRGIRIRAHWSTPLLAGVLMYSLLGGGLSGIAPGYSPTAYAVTAVLTTMAAFASLLIHELSHAFAARRLGVPVGGITLNVFGGTCALEGTADPRVWGRIARTGPLASFAVALAAVSAVTIVQAAGGGTLAAAALIDIVFLNVAVGIFNLMPAGPLDGGRIMFAILCARPGMTEERAASRVAWAGRALGITIAIASVTLAFGQSAPVIAFDIGVGLALVAMSHPSSFTAPAAAGEPAHATAP